MTGITAGGFVSDPLEIFEVAGAGASGANAVDDVADTGGGRGSDGVWISTGARGLADASIDAEPETAGPGFILKQPWALAGVPLMWAADDGCSDGSRGWPAACGPVGVRVDIESIAAGLGMILIDPWGPAEVPLMLVEDGD